jgi:MFS family permease
MPLPRGLRALSHRDYRLFWIGQLLSRIGTWMQSVGQAWLVLELTNSPFRLGLISTLQFGPVLLFSFVGGVLSDRVAKRKLILVTQVAMMLQAFALSGLVWTGHIEYWHVALLAAIYGVANSLDMPARQAYVVELVGKPDLLNAIALNSAVFNGARVVGPALAGSLIAAYGVGTAFLINGISFVAVLAALVAMRTDGAPHPGARATMREEIMQSLRYAGRTPRILLVLALLLFVSLFVINFNVVVPLIARDVFAAGAHGFGLLMACLGVGAVLGAVGVASAGLRRPSMAMVVVAALVASAGVLGLGFVRSFHARGRDPRGDRHGADRLHLVGEQHRAGHGPGRDARPHDEPLCAGLRGRHPPGRLRDRLARGRVRHRDGLRIGRRRRPDRGRFPSVALVPPPPYELVAVFCLFLNNALVK